MSKSVRRHSRLLIAVFALAVLTAVPMVTLANHSWGGYHWARTSNPFTLKVGDNVDANWDAYLDEAIADWSASSVLDLTKVAGGTAPKSCRPTAGRIEACNAKYGNTGWLGIAQIWLSGGHISQAITKLNDTYFNTATYNTPAWRRLVTCQEIAHDFGLDHQDETFGNANLGSCMDYTDDPDGGAGGASSNDPSNEHPNAHDFDQLVTIYSHLDSSTTIGSALPSSMTPAMRDLVLTGVDQFGPVVRAISNGGGLVTYHEQDFGNGNKIIT
ncbi:hypothetical protein EHM82_06840, partial [bacterium]